MHDFCYNCMADYDITGRFCPKCGFEQAAYAPESHQLPPGTLLRGRYRIGRVLGEGGFGITYVGWDTVLNLKVAVKEFFMTGYVSRVNTYSPSVQVSTSTHGAIFQKNRDRFLDEARVLARFAEEEGIVGIRDFFEENNTAYIVMSFLSGMTLKAHLKQQGRLSWDETFRVMRPVLMSLCVVHGQGVIHRDISPDNIMLTTRGQVKLLDFGAAREFSDGDARSLSVILKPGYAPEEQYRTKGQQGPWTDIYALCATMYRCLTGVTPDESMERLVNDQLKPPAALCDCPPAVSHVLMKGLSIHAQDRYQAVSDLLQQLQAAESHTLPVAVLSEETVEAVPSSGKTGRTGAETSAATRRSPLVPILAALTAVLLIALAVVLISGRPGAGEDPDNLSLSGQNNPEPQEDTPAETPDAQEDADVQEPSAENTEQTPVSDEKTALPEQTPPADTSEKDPEVPEKTDTPKQPAEKEDPDPVPEEESTLSEQTSQEDTPAEAPEAQEPAGLQEPPASPETQVADVPEQPAEDPLAGLDVEAEVRNIRSVNTAFVTRMNAGEFTAVTLRRGVIAYLNGDEIVTIQVSADVDGIPYARSYYYENEELYFAYYSGTDSHRFYFYQGHLIRWRHTPDASDNETVTDHDLEDSDAFRQREADTQADSDALIAETRAFTG